MRPGSCPRQIWWNGYPWLFFFLGWEVSAYRIMFPYVIASMITLAETRLLADFISGLGSPASESEPPSKIESSLKSITTISFKMVE